MKTITIAIGGGDQEENLQKQTAWHAADTNAPVDYDGFGTFAVTEYEERDSFGKEQVVRTVLIRDEHYTWQTQRYSSGNHWSRETLHDEAAIAEELWKRLRGAKDKAPDYTKLDSAINRTVGFLQGLADGQANVNPHTEERCRAVSKMLSDAQEEAR